MSSLGGTEWLNSGPLGPAARHTTSTELIGHERHRRDPDRIGKYAGHGLVVIGVHTPEFRFEHNLGNVRRAVQDMRIGYPIATDNEYAVWSAFGNHYWPAPILRRRAGAHPASPLRRRRMGRT